MGLTKEQVLKKVPPKGYLDRASASAYYDALMALPDEGRLLEIGTRLGHSTRFFAHAKPSWVIYTVDSWKVAAPEFSGGLSVDYLINKLVQQWRKAGLFNIVPIVGNSFDVPWELPVDALYIDGDHSYDAVKSDFIRFTPFLKEGGVVMMDDYGTRKKGIEVKEFVDTELVGEWDVRPVEGGRGAVLWRR
jgi:hypothetical protein